MQNYPKTISALNFDEGCYFQELNEVIKLTDSALSSVTSPRGSAEHNHRAEMSQTYGSWLKVECLYLLTHMFAFARLRQVFWSSFWQLTVLAGRRAWRWASSYFPSLFCLCMLALTGEFGSSVGILSHFNNNLQRVCLCVHTGLLLPSSSSSPGPSSLRDSRLFFFTHQRYVDILTT